VRSLAQLNLRSLRRVDVLSLSDVPIANLSGVPLFNTSTAAITIIVYGCQQLTSLSSRVSLSGLDLQGVSFLTHLDFPNAISLTVLSMDNLPKLESLRQRNQSSTKALQSVNNRYSISLNLHFSSSAAEQLQWE
jgi:hypothetical protein